MRYRGVLVFLLGCSFAAQAQVSPEATQWGQARGAVYVGLRGTVFINHDNRLTPPSAALSPADKFLEPQPELALGYVVSSRLALEIGLTAIPVSTGYAYVFYKNGQWDNAGSNMYTNTYAYIPVRAVVRVLGAGHRLQLSAVAGGGPAFTDLKSVGGLPIGPNYTSTSTDTDLATGITRTTTATHRATYEASGFAVLEAGLQADCYLGRAWAFQLRVRQLWGLIESAREVRVDVATATERVSTTLSAPVRGVAVGLGVGYRF